MLKFTSHCTRKTPLLAINGVIAPINGVITLLTSGRGPPCSIYIICFLLLAQFKGTSQYEMSSSRHPPRLWRCEGRVGTTKFTAILIRDDWKTSFQDLTNRPSEHIPEKYYEGNLHL